VPEAPRVLTVPSAAGEILRASNLGGWNVYRPTWATTSHWLGENPAQPPERTARADPVRRWLYASRSVGT